MQSPPVSPKKRSSLPPEFIGQLKERVPIQDLISEVVTLKKAGVNYSGLCPFHAERSPSFFVHPQKQIYHCYGCHEGGDAIEFLKKYHGLSFIDAIRDLSERAHLALPKEFSALQNESPEAAERRSQLKEKEDTAYRLNLFSATFYRSQLSFPENKNIREYVEKRGVSEETQKQFLVGVSPRFASALAQHLIDAKAPIDLAQELGLIKTSIRENTQYPYFDHFRDRITFPIADVRGKIIAFGGRILTDAKAEGPKFLNSNESFIFQKSKTVYGLFQAQKHIRETDESVVVEGYFDVLALHSAGFQNVVATCGTALTHEHIKLLSRFGSKQVILFDGDSAGIEATTRALEMSLEHQIILYGATLPLGKDPDEIVLSPNGKEAMDAILKAKRPLLESAIDAESETAKQNPAAKADAIKKVAKWISKLKDPISQNVWIEFAEKKLQANRSLFTQSIGKKEFTPAQPNPVSQELGVRNRVQPQPITAVQSQKLPPLSRFEKILLGAFVRWSDYGPLFLERRKDMPAGVRFSELYEHSTLQNFVSEFLKRSGGVEQLKQVPELFLTEELDSQILSIISESLISQEAPFSDAEVSFALDRAIHRLWARFSQLLKTQLAQAELQKDLELQEKLLKEYLDVQRKMKELKTIL